LLISRSENGHSFGRRFLPVDDSRMMTFSGQHCPIR
jgi:hypothetical protein